MTHGGGLAGAGNLEVASKNRQLDAGERPCHATRWTLQIDSTCCFGAQNTYSKYPVEQLFLTPLVLI